MTIKRVESIDVGTLTHEDIQATLRIDDTGVRVFIAREDYYESGGIAYSGIELTRDDLVSLLNFLNFAWMFVSKVRELDGGGESTGEEKFLDRKKA